MSDAKYFQRGKIQELRAELNSDKKDVKYARKKVVMKKIVANMTMGNDMSSLYQDVLPCMEIPSLEVKKMVYLYLINYARSKPEMAGMAVNYFLKDITDSNPLIRALAIRTMSYINVEQAIDSLCDPLRRCLRDQDPYVRKTAAICVAKLYMHDSELVEEEGFVNMLRDMLADSNPTVVANSVAALTEISERSDNIGMNLNMTIATKLIAALNECSEWGQSYILEALMYVVPQEPGDTELLVERIAPRLQHANSSVVLTAVKLIMYLMNYMTKEEDITNLCKKLSPPLVTLLSSEPEVQYVALRNILLIIQKRPDVLKNEMKVFFCRYDDPIYVKLAKLEIIFRLANVTNVNQVLMELKEYATEVDVDFVRKAVRCIGRLAIKIESAAERCIETLLDLIQTKVNYVVQEAIVVIKDIFRKYPNQYESIINKLCENLDSLDEPEAKVAMIWIIGQYAERIENSYEVLEGFLDTFLEETTEVQLALLTATIKLFIKRPSAGQELVPRVLKWATEEVDNPDLRDRGYIYWRLLSTDPAAAKAVLLSDKPQISTESDNMDTHLLDELLLNISSLASIYHKPPTTFIKGVKPRHLPASKLLNQSQKSPSYSSISTPQATSAANDPYNISLYNTNDNPYTTNPAPVPLNNPYANTVSMANPYSNNINAMSANSQNVGNLLDLDF
ncbi:putative beta-adaptin [Basidiobolus meristosporus CBS 931.73]|uniref:AP complex subunit beta n=1 Tax=Basidiobolus meristosporus CBS 931.73 TaxID=1314790 RepID=A0A1Y1Y0C9_9FUNG|nr:putative beta-adaptin [Basidiobolus meristosporus CBS 931.73]|eukprot:ORX91460.1 putative beta-adaptin [Basidiobolus meristosporus CBS 931.73]